MSRFFPIVLLALGLFGILAQSQLLAQQASSVEQPGPAGNSTVSPSSHDLAFFESRIRPVLVDQCYGCHSADSKQPEGGLRLDEAKGWINGGGSGPALKPGDVEGSLLIRAIRHTDAALKMPEWEKLPDAVIADFETWVRMGAPAPDAAAVPTKADDSASGRANYGRLILLKSPRFRGHQRNPITKPYR